MWKQQQCKCNLHNLKFVANTVMYMDAFRLDDIYLILQLRVCKNLINFWLVEVFVRLGPKLFYGPELIKAKLANVCLKIINGTRVVLKTQWVRRFH